MVMVYVQVGDEDIVNRGDVMLQTYYPKTGS